MNDAVSLASIGRSRISIGRVLLTIGLPLVVWGLARGAFVPLYQSNDDIGMTMLARGVGIVSKPTPYLLYLHIELGRLLVTLYAHWPAWEWYRILMDVIQLLSTATLVWLSLRLPFSGTRLTVLALYLVVFDLGFYIRPNFTETSILAACAATVLWFSAASRGRGLTTWSCLWFLMLLNVSSWVRFQGAIAVAIVAVPLVLLALIRRQPKGSRWASGGRLIAPWLLGCLSVLGGKLYHDHVYGTTPGWANYDEFNRLRAEITDYHRVGYGPASASAFARAGWTNLDYEILENWFFEDPETYSIERFRRLLDSFPPVPFTVAGDLFTEFLNAASSQPALMAMLLAVMAAGILSIDRQRTHIAVAMTILAVLALGVVLLLWLRRWPPMIYEPLLAVPVAIALAGIADGAADSGSALTRFLAGLLFAAAIMVSLREITELYRQGRQVKGQGHRLEQTIDQLKAPPHRIYVIVGAQWPFELFVRPESFERLRGLDLVGTGALSQTPINQDRLRGFGINSLMQALGHRPDLRLLGNRNSCGLIASQIATRTGSPVRAQEESHVVFGEYEKFEPMPGRYVTLQREIFVFRILLHSPESAETKNSTTR
jgi:hypothetical protein